MIPTHNMHERRRCSDPGAGSGLVVPALTGPTDPCTAFDHPNVSLVHTIKVSGLRVSPEGGISPLALVWQKVLRRVARAMAEGLQRSTSSHVH